MSIGGGSNLPRTKEERTVWIIEAARNTGATPQRLATLLDRYGTTAQIIARHEGLNPTPLVDAPDFTVAELDWIVRHEQVMHLADIFLRRTSLAISGQLTIRLCRDVTTIAASTLGWDTEQERKELHELSTLLAEHHGVRLVFE